MKQNNLFLFLTIAIAFCCQNAIAQSYFVAGGMVGFPKYEAFNGILKQYNSAGEHRLGNFGFMPGFEFGVGTYGEHTMMEGKIASLGQTINSHVLNANPEDVTVDFSFTYINYSFGYRPFSKSYFTIGAGVNVGQMQTRYSFLSDWQVMNQDYTAGSEFFIDYAFPIKLKRKREPYLLRIRPYYQHFFGGLNLTKFNANFNEAGQSSPIIQDPSHLGVHLSIIVPFGKDKVKEQKIARPSVDRVLPN